jgi:pimeloyl-ACP methyl ester carboxylesterase
MFVACLRAAAVLLAVGLAAPAGAAALPLLRPAPCLAPVAHGERIACYVLVVPENRHAPHSRTIEVPVTILRSRSAHPAPDPLVYTEGGPGGATIRDIVTGKPIVFLDHRDFIAIEQRGAGLSRPSLACNEYRDALYRLGLANQTIAADPAPLRSAARTCARQYARAGVDPAGYTTEEIAEDVNDLRRALHVRQIDVYGISYSTRVFLELLRRHPGTVRSAILDSTLPPDVRYDEAAGDNVKRALDHLFAACSRDASCDRAFPHLAARFQRLVTALSQHPRKVMLIQPLEKRRVSFLMNGRNAVDAVVQGLLQPREIPSLPGVISAAAKGDVSGLVPLLQQSLQQSDYSWGMRISVLCHDEAPFERPAVLAAQAHDPRLGGFVAYDLPADVCAAWHSGAANHPAQPVRSTTPSLVFAGEYDPLTPPAWGQRVRKGLPTSYFVLMPGRSHLAAIATSCGDAMAEAFLEHPATPPSHACIEAFPGFAVPPNTDTQSGTSRL